MIPSDEMPEAGTVADAPRGNWVDSIAPSWSRPYLRLSRADRPIGTWLLFLPCLWGIALAANLDGFRAWDIWLALSCGMGAFLMRGAGCTWNDITDRDIDAQVARTKSRPLPAGQVTVRQAVVWMVVQTVIAAGILFTYNATAILLGIAALIPVAIYPFAKRFTWWPQAFLGVAFNWGALLGFAAHAGTITPAALVLYLAGVVWTLFYDTIYAHQDKEDDALIGVKSTARLFGQNTLKWLAWFLVITVSLLSLSVILTLVEQDRPLALLLGLAGVWAFGLHLHWQLRQLNPDDPEVCLRLFRSNRDTGLILALFLAAAVRL
ncbi:4-hydroxybenzoate octaprenyltransferase [Neogemmobacter tilapiae]|uniref:4-hydroxybenzoate octaprenyltransferase n=1 Tax=Neogemmobacter tilapiae TaxID=875041 RepID=A0A918TP27_9RHOB|nr:4-hydroxybenzoate octaprenyltransferase [Gemmobacter tilapiae]GHC55922.1 4-hydroxybenzoate octaprenyltransferase [Gemmobacter tilapiae]